MSERQEELPPRSGGGGTGNTEQAAPGGGPATPPTGPSRTVGQRRRDAENKLEQHQQEAQHKTADEKGPDPA